MHFAPYGFGLFVLIVTILLATCLLRDTGVPGYMEAHDLNINLGKRGGNFFERIWFPDDAVRLIRNNNMTDQYRETSYTLSLHVTKLNRVVIQADQPIKQENDDLCTIFAKELKSAAPRDIYLFHTTDGRDCVETAGHTNALVGQLIEIAPATDKFNATCKINVWQNGKKQSKNNDQTLDCNKAVTVLVNQISKKLNNRSIIDIMTTWDYIIAGCVGASILLPLVIFGCVVDYQHGENNNLEYQVNGTRREIEHAQERLKHEQKLLKEAGRKNKILTVYAEERILSSVASSRRSSRRSGRSSRRSRRSRRSGRSGRSTRVSSSRSRTYTADE